MEGSGRDGRVTGAAAPQGRCYGRRCGGGGGGDESESDGSSGGGVDLGLRLRTGSCSPPAVAPPAEQQEAAAARRSMTIFYDGRVCAVDVTEAQAREIISMANRETLAGQRQLQRQEDRHMQDRGNNRSSSSRSRSSSNNATARCGGQVGPVAAAAAAVALSSAAGRPLQCLAAMAAPVTTGQAAALSMNQSLQRFLEKRVARRAGAVAPPYAAAGRQAQAMRR